MPDSFARKFKFSMLALVTAALCFGGCATAPRPSINLEGQPIDPLAGTAPATVLIFVSNDCPVSNRYMPEIHRLNEHFASRGVVFWLVHADEDETPDSIQKHAREYSVTEKLVRDPGHVLVKLSRARVTPSVAVFTLNRQLVYHGRIDDRVSDIGRDRPTATQHDLADALEAILAGRPVPNPETKAMGCYIAGLR